MNSTKAIKISKITLRNMKPIIKYKTSMSFIIIIPLIIIKYRQPRRKRILKRRRKNIEFFIYIFFLLFYLFTFFKIVEIILINSLKTKNGKERKVLKKIKET